MKTVFKDNVITLFEDENEIGSVVLGKQSDNVYRVLRVFVVEEKRGQGVAGLLMKETISYAQKNAWQLLPVCSYAVSFFKKYNEYENILFKQ